jgi:aryl-alcohol dehydrogenase-like predicted oxidoreductase
MNFGERTSESDSFAIMNRAMDLGINFWDTADRYGGKASGGATEQIIGRYFAANSGKRDQVVLATKFQGQMGPGVNDRGASAIHIRNACEASLRRLQTDRIDLYQMHHVNRDAPWEEVYGAFDVLRQQGKIIYAGVSNHAGWHIARGCEAARRLGTLGIVSEQSKYSLASRYIELEVLPACREYGVGVIPWSPLEGGLLGGVLEGQKGVRRESEGAKKKMDAKREQLRGWENFCRERANVRPTRRWRGSSRSPALPRRSSARERSSSSNKVCARWRSTSRPMRWRGSIRSGPRWELRKTRRRGNRRTDWRRPKRTRGKQARDGLRIYLAAVLAPRSLGKVKRPIRKRARYKHARLNENPVASSRKVRVEGSAHEWG